MARRVRSSAKKAVHGKTGRVRSIPKPTKNIQGGSGPRVSPHTLPEIHGNSGKG